MRRPGRIAESDLIYDWNSVGREMTIAEPVEILDETLRDGLQNPSIALPSIEHKRDLVRAMNRIGIDVAKLGLPASSRRAFDDCLDLCRTIAGERLAVRPACSARTVEGDITAVVEIAQRSGLPLQVYAFVGSSPIRAFAEDWDLSLIAERSAEAVATAVREGLGVAFVTEDTTRSRPEVLAELFRVAVDNGAARLCLCDTTGQATPAGVRALVTFTLSVVASLGAEVGIDWHGHNDRGLALENALTALESGAERVHATALGVGERVGNAPMEPILLNLKLLGALGARDLSGLLDYSETAARALGWPIPFNYPVVGRDAFRTAAGVHAAAIVKAQAKGDAWLADRIYSGVPASVFGRHQEICIGAMSGASNVVHWLRARGIEPREAIVARVLERAKGSDRILDDEEIWRIVRSDPQGSA